MNENLGESVSVTQYLCLLIQHCKMVMQGIVRTGGEILRNRHNTISSRSFLLNRLLKGEDDVSYGTLETSLTVKFCSQIKMLSLVRGRS